MTAATTRTGLRLRYGMAISLSGQVLRSIAHRHCRRIAVLAGRVDTRSRRAFMCLRESPAAGPGPSWVSCGQHGEDERRTP